MTGRRLEELSSFDVQRMRPIVAIPIGSCEQHGPHLPLGTDTMIASALGQRLCDRVEGIVLGPALAVTASGEHAGFPGTLSIGTAATAATLVELTRSADWARGVVLVNAHGGNIDALSDAVATIRSEHRCAHCWWPRPGEFGGTDAHAGHAETSVMLALHPELVARERLHAGNVQPIDEIIPRLRRHGVRGVSGNGVLGNPTQATVGSGRQLLDDWTDDLVSSVRSATRAWMLADPASP